MRIRAPIAPAQPDYAEPHIEQTRIPSMSSVHMPVAQVNTAGWVTFTYVSFAIGIGMMALGIWGMPVDLWVKGYMVMASVFLCGSTFTLAKTVRDEHEAKRFANRIEEAKTEKLLMEMNRAA
jgi:hypothetical protein